MGVFPLSANGRSLILNGGKGTVKVLVGDELGEVLGVHILGPNATEIIGEAAVAMEMEATAEEIINTPIRASVKPCGRHFLLRRDAPFISPTKKDNKGGCSIE